MASIRTFASTYCIPHFTFTQNFVKTKHAQRLNWHFVLILVAYCNRLRLTSLQKIPYFYLAIFANLWLLKCFDFRTRKYDAWAGRVESLF